MSMSVLTTIERRACVCVCVDSEVRAEKEATQSDQYVVAKTASSRGCINRLCGFHAISRMIAQPHEILASDWLASAC